MADEIKIVKHTFENGRDTDTADQLVPPNSFRLMQNARIYGLGSRSVARAVLGNTLIANTLASGTNFSIGKFRDEENNKLYYCVWNSNGYHTIFRYDRLTKVVSVVLQNLTDTNNIDILKWSNLKQYRINAIDVIEGRLFTCVDGLNKARKFNIRKAMDKTPAGYGSIITEDLITAYKQTAIYAPVVSYITDTSRNSNNLYGNLFKFTQRFYYADQERSNYSDWSVVPKPPNQSYTGLNQITFDNNCIQIVVATGSQDVKKIEIAFQPDTTEDGVQNSNFFIAVILDKAELNITNNSTYVYRFYNDGSYVLADQDKINRNYSFMPRIPRCQSFVKNAMTYTNAEEGWPVVLPGITVSLRMDQLYLPSDTQNKQSAASLITNEISVVREHPFLSKSRYNNVTKFTIGFEVKKGVKYEVFGVDPNDNYYYTYTAQVGDTPQIIASYIKNYLRTVVHRGYPSNDTSITNEGVDGSGNVYFSYGHLGEYGTSKTVWTGAVTQVSYISLMDNGLSLQLIPYGSTTNYAVVYEDDDGRESLGYTSAAAVIRTPYITEIGDYKQPVHIISITGTPPPLARYWKLVRTPQKHGLEILIQSVVTVPTTNASSYLDLVVGSLLTYQKLHPNTILSYEFEKGDRIRIIKNCDTGVLYSGYFETEVLSYSNEVSNTVNTNAVLNGTDTVTVASATADKIGQVISVNGNERTIIAAPSGTTYKVDSPYSDSATYPNYILIDRRGTIRIKQIPNLTIANNSLVEVFHPYSLNISDEYKTYNDFNQKFEVLGYGTSTPYHAGTIQNQTSSQPAIIEVTDGDAYIRDRELPINNIVPGTQVLVSRVVDSNFSDYYHSDISDLGRLYPQDNGQGVVKFGSRTRNSGNYIEDTGVNGLNDFDNLDRVDNNDPNGDVQITKYLNNRLYLFKTLKDAWIPINHTLTTDNSGALLQVQSGKLLNQLQYISWEGGIGNNPESLFIKENFIYHASTNQGCFVRLGGEGIEPISKIYNFDAGAKTLLRAVNKYNLPLIGEYDNTYDEVIYSMPNYIEYLVNGNFNAAEWQTFSTPLVDTTTYDITQQPATGLVTYDGTLKSFIVTGTTLGDDYFLYRPHFADGSYGAVKKMCITTVTPANRQRQWLPDNTSAFCIQKVVTVNLHGDETHVPYSDMNLIAYNNGTQVMALYFTGDTTGQVVGADALVFSAVSNQPSTGANPTKTLTVKRTLPGGTQTTLYGPTTGPNYPTSPDVSYPTTAVDGAVYDIYETTSADALPSDSTGILVVDIFTPNIDVTGYVDTPSTTPYDQPVYTGQNFYPSSTPPQNCWALASDQISGMGSLKYRFEFNVARLISIYPSMTSFVFKVSGRASSAGTISGSYSLQNGGAMGMNGTPGTYVPTSSGTLLPGSPISYSGKAIVGGADGTHGIGVGAVILTFTYDVVAKTMTLS